MTATDCVIQHFKVGINFDIPTISAGFTRCYFEDNDIGIKFEDNGDDVRCTLSLTDCKFYQHSHAALVMNDMVKVDIHGARTHISKTGFGSFCTAGKSDAANGSIHLNCGPHLHFHLPLSHCLFSENDLNFENRQHEEIWRRNIQLENLAYRHEQLFGTSQVFREQPPPDVLEQYEGKHDWFKYMGAHPIDFDKEIDIPYQIPKYNNGILQLSSKKNKKTCVANELCNIDIKSLYQDQGYEVLGFVFNTDEHDKSGEHWFSMLVDFVGKTTSPQYKGPSILYYDSAGVKGGKILKEISALIKRIQEEFLSITGERIELAYNKQQHQFKNTECGVYCLYFLTSLLDGTSLQEYMELNPDDKYIEQYRDVYFNKV